MAMYIYSSLEDMGLDLRRRWAQPLAMTLGTFDGVHVGHQALLHRVVTDARQLHCIPAAAVFAPHPQYVLRGHEPPALGSLTQRLERIAACGIAAVTVVEFTTELAQTEPDVFAQLLCETLRPHALILGYDFRFGYRGAGSLATFDRLPQGRPELLDQVQGLQYRGAPVSSSRIRRALQDRQLSEATAMLGRPYSVRGRVTRGHGRGRRLGYPTANLQPDVDIALPTGIYAGRATIPRTLQTVPAAISLGYNPTFADRPPEPVLEVHLLDSDQDLYDQDLDVEFLDYLRGEMRFDSVAALVAQIERDVQATRQLQAPR